MSTYKCTPSELEYDALRAGNWLGKAVKHIEKAVELSLSDRVNNLDVRASSGRNSNLAIAFEEDNIIASHCRQTVWSIQKGFSSNYVLL